MRATIRLGTLFALAAVAPACGRGGGRSGDAPEWLAAEARQVDLEITLDADRARAREIGPEGGTLTATADDGTRFQLRIPKGALLAPERITMIPVREVRGLPLQGDDFVTVQLEPSGLQLLQPATLTIRTKREIPVAEQVAFAYQGMGRDAHLYPLGLDSTRIEMTLYHFSGYGFGRAAPDDPGRLLLQQATSLKARLDAQVAEGIARVRRGELDYDAWIDVYGAAMTQYYDEVLAEILETAERDDRMASCAAQHGTSWMRELMLAGMVRDDIPADSRSTELEQRVDLANAALARIVENAYQKGYERFRAACTRDHDFVFAARRLLALERQAQLLGVSTSGMARLHDALDDCLRFEVEFRSVFETRTPTGGSQHDVAATLRTTLPFVPRIPLDTATLRYVNFTASGDPVTDVVGSAEGPLGMFADARGRITPVGTRPGTFVLHALEWPTYNLKDSALVTNCEGQDETAPAEGADTLLVTFSPGVPVELVRFTPDRESPRIATAVRDFARALGDEATAAQVEREARQTATVTERQDWAQHWMRAHRTQEVSGRNTGDPYQDVGGIYTFKLPPTGTRGEWRADTSWTRPPQMGISLSERSHLIVRHVPSTTTSTQDRR